jgi:GT2 family glycosyltransferase
MPTKSNQPRVLVVVPNWNGADELRACLDSVQNQTLKNHLVVVDNGSIDTSVAIVEKDYPAIELIRNKTNEGYTGGVNPGFVRAIEMDFDYVAPFNNDAVADKDWLKYLVEYLDKHPKTGIATCKILSADKEHLDSTGDYYTTWGLPYPRGRGDTDTTKYNEAMDIFGASGGASLYRVSMLKEIGLFDDDFFAYYEDVDLSFRAQLAGWKIAYVPKSEVYHEMSVTGARIKGFFTYQTMKNLPILFWRNVPLALMPTILPRFTLVYLSFFMSALQRHQLRFAISGGFRACTLLPKKLVQRKRIQKSRRVSIAYITSIITWDLPPNATKLRILRTNWWKLTGKKGDQ